MLAPIILFVYNRMSYAKKVIDSLKHCDLAEDSVLYIFSDGPKIDDEEKVAEVRKYINSINGFKKICIIERQKNLGVEMSVIEGITKVLSASHKTIILEDDTVVAKGFLRYMNDALTKYSEQKKVFYISGYSYLKEVSDDLPQSMFLKIPATWGWGTWDDRWLKYTSKLPDVNFILQNKRLVKSFTFDYSNVNWIITAFQQHFVKEYTWDVLWHITTFLNEGLVLVPNKSLVSNIGMDGSGVHQFGGNPYEKGEFDYGYNCTQLPSEIIENRKYRRIMSKLLRKQNNVNFFMVLNLWIYLYRQEWRV